MDVSLLRLPAIFVISLFFSCTKTNVQVTAVTVEVTDIAFDGKIISNIVYGNNTDWLGQNQVLDLDIYLPTPEITSAKFPLIVFFHGGGFVSGNKESTRGDCQILASKGFTVATVNYRLGWGQGNGNFCLDADVPSSYEAFYRAQQDARAALRFLSANAGQYSIDTKWIFVTGASAGATIALALQYYTQKNIDSFIPGMSDTLGLLQNESNTLRSKYKIKGIGSLWGGLIFSQDIVTNNNAIPTIFFHGMLDTTIPWDFGYLFTCERFPLNFGSKPIYDRLVSFGVPAVAHIDPTGDHGIYNKEFNQDNVACFFQSIVNRQPQAGYYTTQVPNCE